MIFQGKLTYGVRAALRTLRQELRSLRLHRRGCRDAQRHLEARSLRLNLGCGENLKEGWLNIDLNERCDLTLDLREALPFATGSCAIVYCEHFLEHLDYPAIVISFLSECHRILEPGGVFSAGVPDTAWPLLEYAAVRSDGYFREAKSSWHPRWCRTPLEHVNYHFRQDGEHRFAYDFETLEWVLSQAGFTAIARRPFDVGLDYPARELGTLYVAARKGAPRASQETP